MIENQNEKREDYLINVVLDIEKYRLMKKKKL